MGVVAVMMASVLGADTGAIWSALSKRQRWSPTVAANRVSGRHAIRVIRPQSGRGMLLAAKDDHERGQVESTRRAHRGAARIPPAVHGLLPRRGLYDLLSAAPTGGVTLVVAPPGSGKTALLQSWIEDAGLGHRTAWVSVERGEQDAQHFWLSVADELGDAVGRDGFVEKFSPSPNFRGQAVVERLVSDLTSLDEPVVLVIDDLHELRSADALAQLEFLLARRPAELGILLATRHDPQLGLHRLRLTGELTEIRASHLRFTQQETRALLQTAGIVLSDAGLARLQDRTEGWAAGLRLAAISLAGHPDPERFVAEFSGSERTVADYLLAEVLNRQPEEVRRLLLRTSVLERVSGPLADVLTGGSGSERILVALEEANAFVAPVDAGRSWFRYHHLFADLLRLELRRTAPAEVMPLHRAAAGWYEQHGYVVDAIRHAQAAHEWPQAARLLTDNLFTLTLNGQWATCQALFAAFPADAASADAELAVLLALGGVGAGFRRAARGDQFIEGSLDEAEACIAVAEQHAAAVPDERRRRFDLMLGVARLSLASRRGDLTVVLDEVQSLEAAAGVQTPNEVDLGNELRAIALMDLGIAELWSFRLDDARRHLEEGLTLARRMTRPWLEIGCLGYLAMATMVSSVALARDESQKAIAIAEAHGLLDDAVAAIALVAFGSGLVWTGQFADAERWLDRAEALRAEAEPATGLMLHHYRGLLRAGQGRLEEALAEFRAAEEMQTLLASRHPALANLRAALLRTQVRMGETAAARAALSALGSEERDGAELRAAAAAVHLAEGNPQQAVDVLAPVFAGSAPVLLPYSLIEAHLLDAAAHDQLGDERAAEAAVERALDLAEPDGVILPFTITPSRELLERHSRHRTAHATLLTDILDMLAGSPPPRHGERVPAQTEFSAAELRVVRYLPSNLKAPEIAAELHVSANTVKTHLRHIYTKLDAHSRTEAVHRARQLGLLAPTSRLR